MTTVDQPIELEQGWMILQKHITKIKEILDGKSNDKFLTTEEYMDVYKTIYNMCSDKTNDYSQSQQLYDRYQQTLEDYLTSTVAPRLREKSGEFLLEELVQTWSNYKVMVRWLSRCFHYLDRYFVVRKRLPSLHEVGINCFRDKVPVCDALNGEVIDDVLTVVEKERGGEKIDRALYKNAADVIALVNDQERRDEGEGTHGALLKNVAGILGEVYRGN